MSDEYCDTFLELQIFMRADYMPEFYFNCNDIKRNYWNDLLKLVILFCDTKTIVSEASFMSKIV